MVVQLKGSKDCLATCRLVWASEIVLSQQYVLFVCDYEKYIYIYFTLLSTFEIEGNVS